MVSVLSDVAAAALSEPLFSMQDCQQLDWEIRRKAQNSRQLDQLNEADLQQLHADLNCIAIGRLAQDAVGERKTPRARFSRLQAIEKKSLDLIGLLGVQPDAPPWDVPIEHLLDDGIFEDPTVDYTSLVQALRTLSRISRDEIDRMQDAGIEAQTRKPALADYRLYDDLGAVYMGRWGSGRLEASVNNGKGGPSIRFFVFTLERILKREVGPQEVLDALKKIRNGEVDLSSVPSVFSPHGGRRIQREKEDYRPL